MADEMEIELQPSKQNMEIEIAQYSGGEGGVTEAYVLGQIASHNSSANSHQDIRLSIPTKVSDLTNDSDFTSKTYVDTAITNASLGGDVDLTGYAKLTDLDSKSDVTHNHTGVYQPTGNYSLTGHTHDATDISNIVTPDVTKYYVDTELLGKSDTGHLHDDKYKPLTYSPTWAEISGKPYIPTKTTDLLNDSLFVSESYVTNAIANAQLGGSGGGVDLSGYATKDDLLTKANVSHTHDNSDVTVTSDILPSTSNINIGSATNRFKGIYVDEAHLATNTLYIGDTPLIGTEGSTISIKADADQNVDVKTQGTGGTKITSAKQVDIVATGVNGLTNIQATNQVNIQAPTINIQGTSNTIQGNTTFTGNVTIQGSTTSVSATNLEIADNIIELNKGESGQGVSRGSAGIKIDRGDSDAQFMVFDEVDDRFKVGTASAKNTIAYTSEIPVVTNDLTTTLKTQYDSAYAHSQSAHAPSTAQKNSDITKAEIEAKLVGEITTHTHAGDSDKVDKTQIKNTLTETVAGNVLDATQGKALDDKITILNTNKLDKTDVVNVATQVAVDGKALNAVQLNPNVSGTLAQQINDLKGKFEVFTVSFAGG